jgi:hypothetical protein
MNIIVDFDAAGTDVATIYGFAVLFDGILAIQGLCQSSRKRFKFFKLVAGKQIGVAQPAARERALQERHALLVGELIERHATIKREKGKRKKLF